MVYTSNPQPQTPNPEELCNRLNTSTPAPGRGGQPADRRGRGRRPAHRRGHRFLTTLKAGLHAPARLVNLKTIPQLDSISEYAGALHLGPLVTLDTAGAQCPGARARRALARRPGWPPRPNCATWASLGGNLAQETRCWYYRGPFDCWLKGGDTCYRPRRRELAPRHFHRREHCVSVHPSDPATALLALGAEITSGGRGAAHGAHRSLLHPAPPGAAAADRAGAGRADRRDRPARLARRAHGQHLPQGDGPGTWSFALVGVAVCVTWAEGRRTRTWSRKRGSPWAACPYARAGPIAAEQALRGQAITPERAAAAGQAAIAGAQAPGARTATRCAWCAGWSSGRWGRYNPRAVTIFVLD